MAILERKRHLGKRGNPARNARDDIYIPHLIELFCNLAINVSNYYQTSGNSCNQSRTQTNTDPLKTDLKLVSCLLFRALFLMIFMSVFFCA
jgi:hypothetical protein